MALQPKELERARNGCRKSQEVKMRRLDLTCDYCGKTEKGDEHHFNLPKGWYVLGYHSQRFVAYDDWRVTHHFCSVDCMNKAVRVSKEATNGRDK